MSGLSKYKTGDRYQDRIHKDIWEFDGDRWICVDIGSDLSSNRLGYGESNLGYCMLPSSEQYLGNFAKSHNAKDFWNRIK